MALIDRGLSDALLKGMVLSWRQFCPPGKIWQFLVVTNGERMDRVTTGIRWVEAREAAKHPIVQGSPGHKKNDPAPNANRDEGEKPASKSSSSEKTL